jgi:serine protease
MSATGQEHAAQEALDHAVIHVTVEGAAARSHGGGGGSVNLFYHGGIGGIGVETAPKIYLIVWGSQWNNNDPSGEIATLESFYGGIGGSGWLNSVTQYCQGIASGASACSANFAGNQSGMFVGVFVDNASAAPSKPTQSQIAAEAVRAAQFFGNATAASNATVQYVVATATGNSSSGFKRQYCAYHSSATSSFGNVAYTNLPYITDAGASCGANFNGLGPNAGITIVSGHEAAESITDQFPNGGWLDANGAENGDKCAWTAPTGNTTLSTGVYPVQPLWSNAANNKAGGCVMSYP